MSSPRKCIISTVRRISSGGLKLWKLLSERVMVAHSFLARISRGWKWMNYIKRHENWAGGVRMRISPVRRSTLWWWIRRGWSSRSRRSTFSRSASSALRWCDRTGRSEKLILKISAEKWRNFQEKKIFAFRDQFSFLNDSYLIVGVVVEEIVAQLLEPLVVVLQNKVHISSILWILFSGLF